MELNRIVRQNQSTKLRNSVAYRFRMQLPYTKLKQKVQQLINLLDACFFQFLFVLILYCLLAMAVILNLIVLICLTVINYTIIHRIHCATVFSMQSWVGMQTLHNSAYKMMWCSDSYWTVLYRILITNG